MQHHEQLTLGLSENAPRANPDTSQRLTVGLVENPESGNPTSKRLTRGPVENALRANLRYHSVSLCSALYRLSTLSIQAREGEGVIYR